MRILISTNNELDCCETSDIAAVKDTELDTLLIPAAILFETNATSSHSDVVLIIMPNMTTANAIIKSVYNKGIIDLSNYDENTFINPMERDPKCIQHVIEKFTASGME